jgi:hypothetical protein
MLMFLLVFIVGLNTFIFSIFCMELRSTLAKKRIRLMKGFIALFVGLFNCAVGRIFKLFVKAFLMHLVGVGRIIMRVMDREGILRWFLFTFLYYGY